MGFGLDPLLLGENICNLVIFQLLVAYPGMWFLIIPCLCPSYPSPCGSFFISLVAEDIFC